VTFKRHYCSKTCYSVTTGTCLGVFIDNFKLSSTLFEAPQCAPLRILQTSTYYSSRIRSIFYRQLAGLLNKTFKFCHYNNVLNTKSEGFGNGSIRKTRKEMEANEGGKSKENRRFPGCSSEKKCLTTCPCSAKQFFQQPTFPLNLMKKP
jgi:hypothetical protein